MSAIEDQRASCLIPRAGAELRDIERICEASFGLFCIGLGYGTCVDDLDLERRFSRALVGGKIGIIGLE